MNANLETIRDLLDLRQVSRSTVITGRMFTYAGHMLRSWTAPAMRTPAWWTAVHKTKIDLNDPQFTQNSHILHELSRRF